MIIRKEQLASLTAAWERSRRANFISRIRHEVPIKVEAVSQQDLEKQVDDGCKAAKTLAITDTDHIYRFLLLRYLPASVWERPATQEMLVRVLTDTSIEASRRLQFVETSIALRALR
jgi:hypothetical protein